MSLSPLRSRRRLATLYACWFGLPYYYCRHLSPISSPSKIPSNPALPDEKPTSPLKPTNNPTTTLPDVNSSLLTGLQFSISLPENDQSENTQELPPFNSLLSDVRPLLSRPNHLKFQPNHSILGRQHRREYYTNRARRTKRARFNHTNIYNTVSNQSSLHGKVFRDSSTSIKHDSKHISTFSTIGSTSTGDHSTFSLMPFNPLAPAFSQTVNFPPTHLFRCAILPQ